MLTIATQGDLSARSHFRVVDARDLDAPLNGNLLSVMVSGRHYRGDLPLCVAALSHPFRVVGTRLWGPRLRTFQNSLHRLGFPCSQARGAWDERPLGAVERNSAVPSRDRHSDCWRADRPRCPPATPAELSSEYTLDGNRTRTRRCPGVPSTRGIPGPRSRSSTSGGTDSPQAVPATAPATAPATDAGAGAPSAIRASRPGATPTSPGTARNPGARRRPGS